MVDLNDLLITGIKKVPCLFEVKSLRGDFIIILMYLKLSSHYKITIYSFTYQYEFDWKKTRVAWLGFILWERIFICLLWFEHL